ncbi:magnesium-translocating P-type ATPase [Phenylobacterium montanum]|uniref:Magnesium-transporting ATPase, P-type 1 n=1 Tax=Phenylobacterium montanum TaxID=2823693 RepID=A0A975FZR8_9CAUL|nr:magnesium-translocating P-type ATPase [Caulobacter sp. S6]QUD88144.1 magnesium-translocating P-type ATPase [Caulobacter sp. S6]
MAAAPFWTQTPEAAAQALGCGVTGLGSAEAAARLARWGPNSDARRRRAGLVLTIARRLLDPMCLLLLAAAGISAATGDNPSAVIILFILAASVTLDTVQERGATRTAEALEKSVAVKAEVRRDGAFVPLDPTLIVPGDVFRVDVGDIVPADGLILECQLCTLNEAALTGEPYGVAKAPGVTQAESPAEATNALFRGAVVQAGSATALAVGTGANTLFGAAASALDAPAETSPFERDLRQLGLLIARAAAVLVMGVLTVNVAFGRPLVESLMFSVALAVGLTPELLPMITTVTLSRGAVLMARKKVIVKRLAAIHDLGAMTVLCTDKTGTLTSARIELAGSLSPAGEPDERPAVLAAIAARLGGDKGSLDQALVAAKPDAGEGYSCRAQSPFDYQRRMGAALVEGPGGLLLVVKGAPEAVLAACVGAGGARLGPEDRQAVLAKVQELAGQGLRAIAIASRPWSGAVRPLTPDDEADLAFEGLCLFADPPKETAPAAVARLAQAGVRVVVLSGDEPLVVARLARTVGLRAERVIKGADLEQLSTEALRSLVLSTDAFGRLSPTQKVRVVRALQAAGEVVGFLGDGVNDAPAIKSAHIGLSADGATAVARAAADMILLDTDLGVVADGVEEGRRTFANILKYIRMASSSNFGNMLSMAAASLVLPFLPMLAIQILLNNLLYDVSEIGIPLDRVSAADIAAPQRWRTRDVVRFAAVMGPLSSVFDLATFALLYFALHADHAAFRTGWFIESIATQTLVVFLIRTPRRAWRDAPARALVIPTLAALTLALTIPFTPLGHWFSFASLPPMIVLAMAGIVAVYLVCAEAVKPLAMARTARVR